MNELFMENMVFSLPFEIHLVFVCVAIVIFIVRYAMTKSIYQILMCGAVASTLLLYVNSGKTWFVCVGIIELVLVTASLISVIMDSRKLKAQKKTQENDEAAAE